MLFNQFKSCAMKGQCKVLNYHMEIKLDEVKVHNAFKRKVKVMCYIVQHC